MPSQEMAPQVGWAVNLPLLAHLSVLPNLGAYHIHAYVHKSFLHNFLQLLLQIFKEIKCLFFFHVDFWHFSSLLEDQSPALEKLIHKVKGSGTSLFSGINFSIWIL